MDVTITGNAKSRKVWVDGKLLDPTPSQLVYNHSPDGFNWGYEGSGPAQLAIAIMLLYLEPTKAGQVYQKFKREVIAKLPVRESFWIKIDIDKWIC
jgi:hypothetical protein